MNTFSKKGGFTFFPKGFILGDIAYIKITKKSFFLRLMG